MKRIFYAIVVSAALGSLLPARAQAGLVDPLVAGALVVQPGVTFSVETSSIYGAGPTYSDGFVYGVVDPLNASNVVFGWNGTLNGLQAGWPEQFLGLRATFASPVSSVSLDFGNNDAYSSDWGTLAAFDSAGNLLEYVSEHIMTPGQWVTLSITRSTADIAWILGLGNYLVFATGNSTGQQCDDVLIDHLQYGGAVPEPASWLMALLAGASLLGLGWLRRPA